MRWAAHCTEAWAQAGSKYDRAVGLRMRGLLAQAQEDYVTAEQLFQDVLVIWRELKNDHGIIVMLNGLGVLERVCEQYVKADQYFREALDLAAKQNLKGPQAYISSNLGLLALDSDHWTEAGEWFEKSLSLSREVGRQDLIAFNLHGLAQVNEEEGHSDLALPLAQEALAIRERLGDRNEAKTRALVERLKKKVGEG
jgi:tetratricopeptide (TPR) repeat protein